MVDADVESRLSRVEMKVADLQNTVNSLVPITSSVSILTERVETIGRQMTKIDDKLDAVSVLTERINTLGLQVTKLASEIDDRESTNLQERRDSRRAMYGLIGIILAAVITAIATVIASSGHL